MRALVIADNRLREELLQGEVDKGMHIEWVSQPEEVKSSPGFDVCIDLLFESNSERIRLLKELKAPLIFINSVVTTLEQIQEDFVRFNGWHTFLKRPVAEVSCRNDIVKEKAQKVFAGFGKKTEWVPDIPGFITSRIVAAIINEAYFALEERVSSKEEIDIAMKLGTNYPYGPFEWSQKIGLEKIHALLIQLAKEQKRYKPAALLTKEALA